MRTSVSLNDELSSYVEETAPSAGENNAEAIREVVRHARQLEADVEELEATVAEREETIAALGVELEELEEEIAELETDVERLQNEKQQILQQREEHKELVRQVERERSLAERKAEAGLGQRLKWAMFGMGDDEE
jgi:chromosome segregation ATPase